MKTLLLCLLLIGNQSFSQSSDSLVYLNYNKLDSTYKIVSDIDTNEFLVNSITLYMVGAPRVWKSHTNYLNDEQKDILKMFPTTSGMIILEYTSKLDGEPLKFIVKIN